uniref:SufB protein n=2 Tax=Pavlovaceae TaxID=418969 RepID=M1JFF9_DIALT|nr:SufB protein [Diacronema lutheri]YP_009863816.1 protein SufB [Pavlova sp. NIVA-4/92]AGE93793.1 SufB protein [Diacronema lutheri]QKE31147.1 protein SufB [Pavlova sp. NIVA-4/92]|mmetsp:Transcript_10878/g.34345  ORF Transcript_10878/g.34345 Transcript_10878/m.34345 type:complete len:478 (+) Transcript_10878:2800-4233(+)
MKESAATITKLIQRPYKYGFSTEVEIEDFPRGLDIAVVEKLSMSKNEPKFLLEFRKKALEVWKKMDQPSWAHIEYPHIDYQSIQYYSAPKNKADEKRIDPKMIETFEQLGIKLSPDNCLSNVAVDAVFDSISLGTTLKEELLKEGIIFCSISSAVRDYPNLVKSYLGRVVPIGDNFFSALNCAVFSDGSFCYVPKNVKSPIELSTYFRINNEESGQFERTLLIGEENSYISYLEGCTAPQYKSHQLHAAIVELIAFKHASIKYSTVQNWYAGDSDGKGGVFNFVTKRALCVGDKSKVSWTQVETGSSITWKYPSCILLGNRSQGEFYSVALTHNRQQADTGTKMIHIGKNTKSNIISKGISAGRSKNTYRGLVQVGPRAYNAKNYSQCDSLLISNQAEANTFPYIQVQNFTAKIEHEASVSKVGEEQIFYFLQRGISIEKAVSLIMMGFCKQVFNKLPMEFAQEADRLLSFKIEGNM